MVKQKQTDEYVCYESYKSGKGFTCFVIISPLGLHINLILISKMEPPNLF